MLTPQMMHVYFGVELERRSDSKYYWDNEHRPESPYVILQHTIEGEGVFEIDGSAHRVPPEHVFIVEIPSRSKYYFPPEAHEPWIFRYISYAGDFSIGLWLDLRKQFGPVLPLPVGTPAEKLYRELTRLVGLRQKIDPFTLGEMSYQFYLAWFLQLQYHHPLAPRLGPLKEAEAFCRQQFRRPIAVKEIADHVGMTREHFTRLFCERHPMGPAAYLRSLRLKEARHLQYLGRYSMKELAQRTGFSNARQLRRYLT